MVVEMARALTHTFTLLVAASLCASCVAMDIKAPDAEHIVKMENAKLADKFWRYTNLPPDTIPPAERALARAQMFDEMVRRRMVPTFSANEYSLIRSQQLAAGMSRNALIYSWGDPSRSEPTKNKAGVAIEHLVYSRADRGADYVHLERNKVKTWEIGR